MKEKMTLDEAVDAMRNFVENGGDIEIDHQMADEVLCAFIRHCGGEELAKLFEKLEKWYS